jgi:hypothetical protein
MTRPSYLADEVPKMAAELKVLRARVAELEAALRMVSRWREACHNLDADLGHPARYLGDNEEWDRVEEYATAALAPRPDDGEREGT